MENSQINEHPKDVSISQVTHDAFELVETASLIATESKDKLENFNSNDTLTVPYILNGELYEILSRNGENVTVRCCSCPSSRCYRGSVRSTGNFHMHIKRRHPYLLGKLHAMKVRSLLERRDRLMKNRKAKLRRILGNNKGAKGDHEQHKLKIKRAFQRHQAEAKGNENGSLQEIISTELITEPVETQEIPHGPHDADSSGNENFLDKANESLLTSPPELTPKCSPVDRTIENNCRQLDLDVKKLTPIKEVQSFQESTLVFTPYQSSLSCESTAFGDNNNNSSYLHLKGDQCNELPLDLSRGNRSQSPAGTNINGSSGIGLEPIWSRTTVENTVSTAISVNDLGSQKSSQSECSNSVWWQECLASVLRDIRNDIRVRNRIEHNRLLLEIAKLKFLHPDFFFTLQE